MQLPSRPSEMRVQFWFQVCPWSSNSSARKRLVLTSLLQVVDMLDQRVGRCTHGDQDENNV
jgi:hypothetical protein